MTTPRSEAEIRTILGLDRFAAVHPAPAINEKMESVIELEGTTYTRAAVDAALQAADDATVRDLLGYEGTILAHNNISYHGGAASDMEIARIVSYCASSETMKRIRALQGK